MPKTHLTKVIKADCVINEYEPTSLRGHNCIKISEADPSAKLKELILKDIQQSDLCLCFDIGGGALAQYSPLLKEYTDDDGYMYNKRCDFILIRSIGSNTFVYFADLKSESPKRGEIFNKLQASKLFFDYVVAIIKLEMPKFKLLDEYIPKYACFHIKKDNPMRLIRRPVTQRANRPESDNLKFFPVEINAAGTATTSADRMYEGC